MVLDFAKYRENPNETQIRYTLENIIECSSKGAFKMVGCSKWLCIQLFFTVIFTTDCKAGEIIHLVVYVSPSASFVEYSKIDL